MYALSKSLPLSVFRFATLAVPPEYRLFAVSLSSGVTFSFVTSHRLLVHARMVGDHRLRELLDLGVGRLCRGELARVDVDLIGGDDDLGDLRVVDVLRVRARDRQQQRTGNDKSRNLHAHSLNRLNVS